MTSRSADVPEAIGTWYGALLVQGRKVLGQRLIPPDQLEDRAARRARGEVIPEEAEVLKLGAAGHVVTRDRRLADAGAVPLRPGSDYRPDPAAIAVEPSAYRRLLMARAESALRESWDPSIHVEEAVRSIADLDEVRNLIGERLVSWGSRDLAMTDEAPDGAASTLARNLRDLGVSSAEGLGPTEPSLSDARRALAGLYGSIEEVREVLEGGVVDAMPRRAPNVTALLGPLLAARILSQAGGLDRLARLPSSTIQVLGAEKAFFEHLRGRAPPPRHGLLFLHPTIQGAPRRLRGKLARALAGKVAIAARLDRDGAALRPDLKAGYEARQKAVRSEGTGRRTPTSR